MHDDLNQRTANLSPYRVGVGLIEYVVQAVDPRAAIGIFRSRLCREFPRLWDVIHEMSDDKINVRREDASPTITPSPSHEAV